jgi:capsular exopolysaccharide synthesis family protein
MKEPSELAKALEVVLKSSALEQTNNRERYSSPPVVVYGEENSPEGEVHLRDYWRTIRKRLWLIVGVTLIISSIAAIRQARLPDRYTAKARVQVDAESYSPAMGASKGSTYYIDNSYVDPEYFNTQLQILTSPTLLRRVAKNLDLEHNRNFLNSQTPQRSTWQSLLKMVGLDRKTDVAPRPNQVPVTAEDPTQPLKSTTGTADEPGDIARLAPYVSELQAILEVEPVRRTRLIDIRATHTDPTVATKVANAVADAFGLWNLDVRTKTNSIAGTYLQKRIAELQSQIRNGEEQLVNYAQSHQILSLDSTQNTVVERLAGLNKQLLDAENERNLAEAAYKSNLAPGAAAASAEVKDKQISDLRAKLADLKQKKVQLLLTDTEESPEVKDVTEQINTLEKQLTEARSDATSLVTTNLETNYRQALAREKTLRESFDKQRAETVTQNQAAINYNILKQEIQTNKGLLEGLMQRAKENDVSMAGTPNNIHVVDYASEPDGPVGPRRIQGIVIAALLSLAFGVALALFLEYLDDTVKSPEDVERGLRLPSLAVIPIAGRSARQMLPFAGKQQRANGNGNGRELLLNAEGPSVEAEAYRHLRTSVLLSTPGRAPRTLLVTSSLPSEGKTTTVVNMATVLSQTDSKVLVIDADMRRPRLHHLFDMENRAGLSSLLSSEITADELLSVVNRYGESNIYLLASGPIPPNPAELLGSEQMRNLIARASADFKYVIIDSPPIASFTDGVLISAIVDGVLLVVQGGKTSRQVVKRTRQMLQEIGAKVIGVVLNKIDLRSQDYYYYHQDYKNYYYSESNGNESAASKALAASGKN